jgi:hypothetical protein
VGVTVEFYDRGGELVATVAVRERTELFWRDGTFAPGPAFAAHAGFFRVLEDASRRFQAAFGEDEARVLGELAQLWADLNHRFRVRRGDAWLVDVALLLDGDQARVRYYAAEPPPRDLSEAQLAELERLIADAEPGDVANAARSLVPRLIAEIRRTRG